MAERERELDVGRVCKHLRKMFDDATQHMERANRDSKTGKVNDLYSLQVDYMYLVDEVMRGPRFSALKAINDANALIESIAARTAA